MTRLNKQSRLQAIALLLLVAMQLFSALAFAAREVKRPEEVFRFEVNATDQALVVSWDIEDGYYLYRDKMKFSAPGATLGEPVFPGVYALPDDRR